MNTVNTYQLGGVAQLGEHLPCKQGVKSSNLSISTKAMSRAKIFEEQAMQACLQSIDPNKILIVRMHVTK